MPRPPLNARVSDATLFVGSLMSGGDKDISLAAGPSLTRARAPLAPSAAAAALVVKAAAALDLLDVKNSDDSPSSESASAIRTIRALVAAAAAGGGILPFLDTLDATRLRLVCSSLCAAVTVFPWFDMGTRIQGSLHAWRTCFPCARAASVRGRTELVDSDFVHFAGIAALDMGGIAPRGCAAGITDAAFAHLRGVSRLWMPQCGSVRITERALDAIAGIRELDISFCSQFPDSAFARIAGIHTLIAGGCMQLTDGAMEHLAGIHTLSLFGCRQATLTSSAFKSLRGIKELVVYDTNEDLIKAASALLAEGRETGRDALTN